MGATVGGPTGGPHVSASLRDFPASGTGDGVGLVLIAELAFVVDREPGATVGFSAHPSRLEGAGRTVVARYRTPTDLDDVFRHTPPNEAGSVPIPGASGL